MVCKYLPLSPRPRVEPYLYRNFTPPPRYIRHDVNLKFLIASSAASKARKCPKEGSRTHRRRPGLRGLDLAA
jgi:hypothetical protein